MAPLVAMLGWLWVDVYTADDALPPGEGIGAVVIGEDGIRREVVGFSDGQYQVAELRDVAITRVRPRIDGPVVRKFGTVDVELTDDGEQIVAKVIDQPVDLERLGIGDPDVGLMPTVEGSGTETPADQVVLDSLAPFPVTIDIPGARILPADVTLPLDAWQILAGAPVRLGKDDAIVVATEADVATVRIEPVTAAPGLKVPNPEQRTVPLGLLGLIAVPLLAAGLVAAMRTRSASP